MWIVRIKIKHDCTISTRCKKFGCRSYSLGLNTWHDKSFEYTPQKHYIFGTPQKVKLFLLDLKKDRRIFNLKVLNFQVYFIEKRRKKEIPSSFFNSYLFYTKPVIVDTQGWESWELVSREKRYIEQFLTGIKSIPDVIYKIDFLKPYQFKNALVPLTSKRAVIKRTESELDQRLEEQLKTGHIEGDQWFRDFQDWFVIAFNNPYNFKHSNSELLLLNKNKKQIFNQIKDCLQVHYGVGVGETELEMVMWQLEYKKYVEVSAIDINAIFIDLFLSNLKDKQIEFPGSKIMFKGYNTTFQNTAREDLKFNNQKFKNRVHICIGGTVGNFKHTEEILSIFNRNSEVGDKLLIGFQLNNHINQAFEKYRNNKYYPKFVLNYFDEKIDYSKIKWRLNKKSGFITMHYKGLEVFRTKKFNLAELIKDLKKFNFVLLNKYVDEYNNSCVAIFEKVKS